MFSYPFMQRALIVGLLLGAALPCLGLLMALRKQSMIGDVLSHSSLAGVALGLVLGFHPLTGAILCCIVAAFSIEFFRERLGAYSEMALAIVLSAGVGLASLLSDFTQSAKSFHSYLFGSIVAIGKSDLMLSLALAIPVLLLFFLNYRALFFSTFAPRVARLAGVNLRLVNALFVGMTAVTVSLAARTIGILMVSSFMVIPAACAMQLARSFKQTLWLSIVFSELFIVGGLVLSFRLNLKPGGSFVMLALSAFLLILAGKTLWRHWRKEA